MTSAKDESRATAWDGKQFFQALQAGEQWLKQHIPSINALNVFPVPDGDTGTNMHMTLAAALQGVTPTDSCAQVSEQIYRGALMSARGNSGVILSQILRGMAHGLAGHTICGPSELAESLIQASATAYRGASEPREGTILTVIRETGMAAQSALEVDPIDLLGVLEIAVTEAHASVERTPTLLKVLRDAGVVDAGGQGLYIILEGMLRWARGEAVTMAYQAAMAQDFSLAFQEMHHDDDFGYCTNVLIQGDNLPVDVIREHMNKVGTSVVVVGDETLVRIHVHTPMPGDILNFTIQYGTLISIEIANMDQQHAALRPSDNGQDQMASDDQPLSTLATTDSSADMLSSVGLVAVAPGEGFSAIFRSLQIGAVVTGGQTMNPSTQDLLEAIESLPQNEVIVLPNNSNIIMAARQAAELTGKHVRVLPSKTVPQGIAAMMGFGYQRDMDTNLVAMQSEMERVVTAEITTAVRDAQIEDVEVRGGQTIGLLDGHLAAAGDERTQVIDDMIAMMELDTAEIVTIYYGEHVEPDNAQELAGRLAESYPDCEIEVRSGGQPFYDYILSAE